MCMNAYVFVGTVLTRRAVCFIVGHEDDAIEIITLWLEIPYYK